MSPHSLMSKRSAQRLRAITAAMICCLAACSDDPETDERADAATPSDKGDGGSASLYALASEIETPEGDVLYLTTVADLSAPFDIVKEGIELPNTSTFQAIGEQVFVAPNDAPTITRYKLDADDKLERDKTLSFSGVGATSARDYTIISKNKAYMFDYASFTVHVWDPSTMTLTGKEIDLSAARNDDRGEIWLQPWRTEHIRRGKHLFIGGGWWPEAGPAKVSLVLAFDVEADTVKVLEDERCVNLGGVKQTSNGDIYFFAQSYGLVVHELKPCSLVIRNGETEFDADYNFDATDAIGGLVPKYFHHGPGNTTYVEVADPKRIMSDDLEDIYFHGGNDQSIWQLDLATSEANEVESIDSISGTRWVFPLSDGRGIMPVYTLVDPEDEAAGYKSEIYEVIAEGKPVKMEFGDKSDEARARLSDIVRLR